MRYFGLLAATALLGFAPGAAWAQASAPVPAAGAQAGLATQQGGWSQNGWQAGASPAPAAVPAAAASAGAAAPVSASPAHDGRPDGWHGHYHRPFRGGRVPRAWLDPVYTVADWQGWGFAPPPAGMRWIRYYDDAVLIDGTAQVIDVRYGVNWAAGYRTASVPAAPIASIAPIVTTPAPPRVTTTRTGPNTVVTTSVVQVPPPPGLTQAAPVAGSDDAGGYSYGGARVIGYAPGTITRTTTTTEIPAAPAKTK